MLTSLPLLVNNAEDGVSHALDLCRLCVGGAVRGRHLHLDVKGDLLRQLLKELCQGGQLIILLHTPEPAGMAAAAQEAQPEWKGNTQAMASGVRICV